MDIPELGIGIVYFPGFAPIIESNADIIDVVEIEPQTFWIKSDSALDSFVFNNREMTYLSSLDVPLTFHGVGYPIGGTIPGDTTHVSSLKRMIAQLNPVWISEHLSFNSIWIDNQVYNTNFLLPPLQTEEGLKVAVENVKAYANHFDLPFLFETGVNYLRPNSFEFQDGWFVDQLARRSNSYILLDIHNILANAINGRQSLESFLRQVDPERVIQIHLAGGFSYEGYYLDAHSGVSSEELFTVFEKIVKTLPNLKAVTFECLPDYLSYMDSQDFTRQLQRMKSIWEKKGQRVKRRPFSVEKPRPTYGESSDSPTVKEWENTLGRMVVGLETDEEQLLSRMLSRDKGIEIIKAIIQKFRRSQIVGAMRLTSRYILLRFGLDYFDELMRVFWAKNVPSLFALDNGKKFAEFILANREYTKGDLVFYDVVQYEYSSILTTVDNLPRTVEVSFDPHELVRSLSDNTLPEITEGQTYIVTIEPDLQPDGNQFQSVFHS